MSATLARETERPRAKNAGVSLYPIHTSALDWLAIAMQSPSRSDAVVKLIEREMRDRLGEDWQREIDEVAA